MQNSLLAALVFIAVAYIFLLKVEITNLKSEIVTLKAAAIEQTQAVISAEESRNKLASLLTETAFQNKKLTDTVIGLKKEIFTHEPKTCEEALANVTTTGKMVADMWNTTK